MCASSYTGPAKTRAKSGGRSHRCHGRLACTALAGCSTTGQPVSSDITGDDPGQGNRCGGRHRRFVRLGDRPADHRRPSRRPDADGGLEQPGHRFHGCADRRCYRRGPGHSVPRIRDDHQRSPRRASLPWRPPAAASMAAGSSRASSRTTPRSPSLGIAVPNDHIGRALFSGSVNGQSSTHARSLRGPRRQPDGQRGRDQVGLPQARQEAPPRPEQDRPQGQGTLRRDSTPPTRSSATRTSASSSTAARSAPTASRASRASEGRLRRLRVRARRPGRPGGGRTFRWSTGGARRRPVLGRRHPQRHLRRLRPRRRRRRAARARGRHAARTSPATAAVTLEQLVRGDKARVDLPTGRTVDVAIPPGTRSGQTIRLQGPGPAGRARRRRRATRWSPSSSCRIRSSGSRATRSAATSASRLDEAVLGAKVRVPTLDGPVTLTIPPKSSGGRALRLKGKGLPRAGGGRGDLLVDAAHRAAGRRRRRTRGADEEVARDQRYGVRDRTARRKPYAGAAPRRGGGGR